MPAQPMNHDYITFYIVPTTRQELFEAYKNSVKKMREVGVESGNKSISGKKKYVGVSIGYNHRVTIAYNSKVFNVPARDRFPTIVGCGSRYGYCICYTTRPRVSCIYSRHTTGRGVIMSYIHVPGVQNS